MRRIVACLAIAAGILIVPSVARAGSKCVEVSDVVGEQRCERYGAHWSVERKWPITFRFGLRHAAISTEGLSFSEAYKSRNRPKGYHGYDFRGEELGTPSLTGFGFDGGASIFVVGQLYLGLEGGLALGAFRSPTFTAGRHLLRDAGGVDVTLVHGGSAVGYRIPLGRASIRSEVLFGGVLAQVSHSTVLDGRTERKDAGAFRGLIEPRIAADVWFTQHVSVGVYAGMNLLDTGGHATGLSLTWHNRAFDGDMSSW